jgi:epoxyqueuosine reductase
MAPEAPRRGVPVLTAAAVKAHAASCGFDLCGISRAAPYAKLARLATWLDEGRAGDMHYLRDSLDERSDVTVMLPTARSVISLACVYNTTGAGNTLGAGAEQAVVARYARGDDYHDVLTTRVRALLRWMAETAGPGLEALSCVDNGPVQERVFAEQAGLGWIGKNTCVINPRLGSWMFLAEIVTNADLDVDSPTLDQCGTCTRCIEACPTGAITEPYTVDATRCLSYLTIESRLPVADDLRADVHQKIYGCDICQEVCPWNRRAATSDDAAWQARPALHAPQLLDLCLLPDVEWQRLLKGSAMRRAGLRRIRRSLAYAASHLPIQSAYRALEALAGHPSAAFADVADAIAWARQAVGMPAVDAGAIL